MFHCFRRDGSSQSVEVNRLRQLRDRVVAASGLSAELIDVIYREYSQFSPGIAAELQQDAVARMAVLWIVVRPLLAWYSLAGTLVFEQADQNVVNQAVQEVLSVCPRYLGGSSIATLLERLARGAIARRFPSTPLDFAPRIREAARLRFASWAILDPLVRVWTLTTRHLDVVEEVAQWLATHRWRRSCLQATQSCLTWSLGAWQAFSSSSPRRGGRSGHWSSRGRMQLPHSNAMVLSNGEVHDEQETEEQETEEQETDEQ